MWNELTCFCCCSYPSCFIPRCLLGPSLWFGGGHGGRSSEGCGGDRARRVEGDLGQSRGGGTSAPTGTAWWNSAMKQYETRAFKSSFFQFCLRPLDSITFLLLFTVSARNAIKCEVKLWLLAFQMALRPITTIRSNTHTHTHTHAERITLVQTLSRPGEQYRHTPQ